MERKPDAGVKTAEFIYKTSSHFFSNADAMAENIRWAEGTQDIQRYRDLLDNGGDVSWLSSDLSGSQPIPHFVNLFVGSVVNRSFDFIADVIDPYSKSKADAKRIELLRKMQLKPFAAKLGQLGIKVDVQNAPETQEDVDIEMELNYKYPLAASTEIALKDTFTRSNQQELLMKTARDVFVHGKGITRKYEDAAGNEKVRYVDASKFVSSVVQYDDFRDAFFMAEVYEMTVADAHELADKKFSHKEWAEILSGYHDGEASFETKVYPTTTFDEWDKIKGYKIRVLDFEWKSVPIKKWKDKRTRSGSRIVELVDEDYNPTDSETIIEKQIAEIHEGIWVIGTDKMLRYRKKKNTYRKRKNGRISGDCEFSFTVHAPNIHDGINKSMVERIRPHAENIIIYNLQIMHFVMKARPAGAAIDIAGLMALSNGLGDPQNTSTDPKAIYAAFDQTGLFAYSSVLQDGRQITNTRPITPLDNGVSSGIERLLLLRDAELRQIYSVTGFNPTVDGSAPSKDAGLGIEKMRSNSFNLAMKPLADTVTFIMERTANKVAESHLLRLRIDKGYADVCAKKLGDAHVEEATLAEDASLAELSVFVKFRPTDEDLLGFKEMLRASIQANLITSADAAYAEEISKTSIKAATIYLIKAQKEKARRDSEIAQANSQAQAQVATQSALASEEAKQKTLSIEWALKTQYMQKEYMAKAILEGEKGVQERMAIALKGTIDEALIEEANVTNVADNKVDDTLTGKKNSDVGDKVGGRGIPRPASLPRVTPRPTDDAAVGAKQA